MFDTKDGVRRGFHAHKELKQVAIAVRGSCAFLLDDGNNKKEVVLNDPAKGLLIESFVWREMYDFSEDCVLMVLADAHYDEADYSDYDYEDSMMMMVVMSALPFTWSPLDSDSALSMLLL